VRSGASVWFTRPADGAGGNSCDRDREGGIVDLTRLHEELASVVLVGRDLTEVLTDIIRVARTPMPASEATSITLIRRRSR